MRRFSRGELVALVSLLLVALTVIVFGARSGAQSERDGAVTAVRICGQIETVKVEIRRTVRRSLTTLPTLNYYRAHPEELRKALSDTRLTLARFAPQDCYALPEVRAAGVKRPDSPGR